MHHGWHRRSVREVRRLPIVLVAAAAQDVSALLGHGPLERVAGHVFEPERAGRAWMRADLVGPDQPGAVGDIEVGVVGLEREAPRVPATIGAARAALPLDLGAEPCAG